MSQLNLSYLDLMRPEEITIEKCWQVFATVSFEGQTISPIQFREMQKAFFAGFCECFKVMSDVSSKLTEEEACRVFDRLSQENITFLNGIMQEFLQRSGRGAP